MPLVVLTLLTLAATLLLPGSALAQECQGRPGASAIQQYCEAIPEAGGASQRPTGASQGASGLAAPQVQRRLENAGPEGAAVLGLLAASSDGDDSGDGTNGSSGGSGDSGGSGTSSSAAAGSAEPKVAEGGVLRAVTSAVSNGSTVGGGFTGLLVGMAVLAAAFGWISLRRRHTP